MIEDFECERIIGPSVLMINQQDFDSVIGMLIT